MPDSHEKASIRVTRFRGHYLHKPSLTIIIAVALTKVVRSVTIGAEEIRCYQLSRQCFTSKPRING